MKRQIPTLIATVAAACLTMPALASDEHDLGKAAGYILISPYTVVKGALNGAAGCSFASLIGEDDPGFFEYARAAVMTVPGAVEGVAEAVGEVGKNVASNL